MTRLRSIVCGGGRLCGVRRERERGREGERGIEQMNTVLLIKVKN